MRGVTIKNDKPFAYITHNGIYHPIGYFKTIEEAGAARKAKELELAEIDDPDNWVTLQEAAELLDLSIEKTTSRLGNRDIEKRNGGKTVYIRLVDVDKLTSYMDDDEYISLRDAAKKHNVSHETIRTWRKQGRDV